MRTKIVALVLVATIASRVAAQQVDKEKLRKLAKLPTVENQWGFGFTLTGGFTTFWESPDVSAEITALRKSTKNNVTDAERYYRLGELYNQMDDDVRAQSAFAKSVELYRKLLKSQPSKGELLAQFGKTLSAAEKKDEAETVLRKAVKVAPQEWRCWVALGKFLQEKSEAALWGFKSTKEKPNFEKVYAHLLQMQRSPESTTPAQALLDEARNCFDKAVAIAPNNPQTYTERGKFRIGHGFVQMFIHALHDEQDDARKAMFPPEALPDFQRAAELNPNDHRAITIAAVYELTSVAFHNGHGVDNYADVEMWNSLPEATRQSMREAMSKLETFSQSKNKRVAAEASEMLGLLQFVAQETARSETSLRRALALDPSREQSWEMLISIMVTEQRYQNLVSVCTERLKYKNSARNRMFLAKAYDKLNQSDKSEEQVQIALKLEPNDFTANLALAALLIRRSSDASTLLQAGERLAKAGQVLKESPPHKQWVDYALTRGVYLALNGDVEAAEKQLEQVLEHDEDNEDAKEALKAIGKGSES